MTETPTYKQLTSLIFGACVMSLLTSCGASKSTSHSKTSKNPVIQNQELGLEGRYQVKFSPLNASVAGFSNVEAKIQVIADQMVVSITAKDSPMMTAHSQFIYSASECPNENHDTNSDGFIDPVEASAVLGKILIPLDGSLNSQLEGIEQFPTANHAGNYTYYKEGVLSQLISDLQSVDVDPKDELMKLDNNHELNLEGKVIVVQGISNETYLPGSVRTLEGQSDRATLPIACGKIVRLMIDESETSEPEENRF